MGASASSSVADTNNASSKPLRRARPRSRSPGGGNGRTRTGASSLSASPPAPPPRAGASSPGALGIGRRGVLKSKTSERALFETRGTRKFSDPPSSGGAALSPSAAARASGVVVDAGSGSGLGRLRVTSRVGSPSTPPRIVVPKIRRSVAGQRLLKSVMKRQDQKPWALKMCAGLALLVGCVLWFAVHLRGRKIKSSGAWEMGPHLNKLVYDNVVWPVFPQIFPGGIHREDMPQLDTPQVWRRMLEALVESGGVLRNETVDVTKAHPLQAEISGPIVHNHLIGDEGLKMQWKLEETADGARYFNKIVLIKSPVSLQGSNGKTIPRGAFYVLDGHHAWDAARVCDRAAPRTLRGGRASEYNSLCGHKFTPLLKVLVISKLHPLIVRDVALRSGAGTGKGILPESERQKLFDAVKKEATGRPGGLRGGKEKRGD